MNRRINFFIFGMIICYSTIILLPSKLNAQIIPDKSFGSNSTKLFKKKHNQINISGGKKNGKFIFHSFDKFNIRKNQKVIFETNISDKYVISRVTKAKSVLNGSLVLKNNASLIFLNPKGIILGRNSGINLGTFIPSTANRIAWKNNGYFSTDDKSYSLDSKFSQIDFIFEPSKAKVEFFGRIRNSKAFPFLGNVAYPKFRDSNPTGLTFTKGNAIVLSNSIYGEQVSINAVDNDIYLYAVNEGRLKLNFSSNKLDIKGIQDYGNIKFNKNSNVNIFTQKNNSLFVLGDKISLQKGSLFAHYTNGKSSANRQPSLNINSNRLVLSGPDNQSKIRNLVNSPSQLFSYASSGTGADININNKKSIFNGGAQIYSVARNNSIGGDLKLSSRESLTMSGFLDVQGEFDIVNNPIHGLISGASENASAGSLKITSSNIVLRDSANISIYTFNNSKSNNIFINSKNLDISGSNPFGFSTNIQTGTASLRPAGNIAVNSKNISITDTGGIGSISISEGDSGSVKIKSESLSIDGSKEPVIRTSIFSSINNQSSNTVNIVGKLNLRGNTKNIQLDVDDITLNQGKISVINEGEGIAGNIVINSQNLRAVNNSTIEARSLSGNGGSIKLKSPILSLDKSSITSSSEGIGTGGNISINSSFAQIANRSKIIADAKNNKAGNINIKSTFFKNRDSLISASSELGTSANGEISVLQRTNELSPTEPIVKFDNRLITIKSKCTTNSSNSSIEEHGNGSNPVSLSERQKKALKLKQRIEYASQFHYIDSETGEKKPFKPLLGIEKNEEGKLELLFSAEESKGLQNLLSSLDNICSVKS